MIKSRPSSYALPRRSSQVGPRPIIISYSPRAHYRLLRSLEIYIDNYTFPLLSTKVEESA
jgi:hypothetical protein